MFSDIDNHWTKEGILKLAQRNLVTGYPDKTFRPNAEINRAEFATLMCNVFPDAKRVREPIPFQDIFPDYWAYNAIQTASAKGFFAGYPDRTFRPLQQITRIQTLVVITSYLQFVSFSWIEQQLDKFFIDSQIIPSYATASVAESIRHALIVNYPEIQELRPNENATRGEVAALLCRVLELSGVPLEYVVGLDVQPMEIRPLPGTLDTIPTFNSNSPELVLTEGILLSTFPSEEKQVPNAHLNFAFEGRFDIFSHHITRAEKESETHPFYQGIILYNPTKNPVTVQILQAASYLGTPDAPFIDLPEQINNPDGKVYSGPGSRTMGEVLRGWKQDEFPAELMIEPQQYKMLMSLPIPVPGFPASNGRSTMMRLSTNGQIYVANLAKKASLNSDQIYRSPSLQEWIELLNNSGLAEPRDATPTPLEPDVILPIVFSRVSGVSEGTQWRAEITDPSDNVLTIPPVGEAFSYVIGTVHKITLGTAQVQSAKMLVRYRDTAYFAHANYGIEYKINFTLYNRYSQHSSVHLMFSSPLKNDEADEVSAARLARIQENADLIQNQLVFLKYPPERTFFRGTVRVTYEDSQGVSQIRYFHLSQRRGQQGQSLMSFSLPPNSPQRVEIDFLYPPDSTPPQVITIKNYDV